MKITNSKRSFDSDEKRFYVPGAKIEAPCRKCGLPIVRDLGDSYLDYPTFNKPFNVELYCDNETPTACCAETTVRVVLRLTIEEA